MWVLEEEPQNGRRNLYSDAWMYEWMNDFTFLSSLKRPFPKAVWT